MKNTIKVKKVTILKTNGVDQLMVYIDTTESNLHGCDEPYLKMSVSKGGGLNYAKNVLSISEDIIDTLDVSVDFNHSYKK